MRSRISGFVWGLLFIVAGIGFAGNAFDLWDFSLFFDGWWTLFITVPCLASIIQNGVHTPQVIGLSVGALLLLSEQDIIRDDLAWKMLVPVLFVAIGVRIIFRGGMNRQFHASEIPHVNHNSYGDYTAVFGGREARRTDLFEGANITAVFGGVELDLRNAVITQDVTINATAIFGGVEIWLPQNVRVKISCTPILGGVTNKVNEPPAGMIVPTVYINALCTFGGTDIK